MKKYLIGLAVGVALTLVLTAGGAARDDKDKKDKEEEDKDVVGARKEVLDVVKLVEGGKDDKALAGKAAEIHKKSIDLTYLMAIYRIKEKGGIGFGEKPDDKSGIEAKIIALQRNKRGPAPATLKKEAKDLIKLAQVNVAMAEIARPHFPGDKGGKTKKDWNKWLDDQKKAAKELMEAVKKEDPKGVAKAAADLLNACTECHAEYKN